MLVSKAGNAKLCLAVPERAWSSQGCLQEVEGHSLKDTAPLSGFSHGPAQHMKDGSGE